MAEFTGERVIPGQVDADLLNLDGHGSDRNARNAAAIEIHEVVQTARRARPSVGGGGEDGPTVGRHLVEHVADLSRDAPILLLCVARPELLERRAGWAGGEALAGRGRDLNLAIQALAPLLDRLGLAPEAITAAGKRAEENQQQAAVGECPDEAGFSVQIR